MSDQVIEIVKCRACQSPHLKTVIDLGVHWLAGFYKSRDEGYDQGRIAPLKVVLCQKCWLAQLAHTTPPDWLYRQFWYKSGVTETMRETLRSIAVAAHDEVWLEPGDSVCDIGANDGTLLRFYPEDVHRFGFEPAMNLQAEASEGGNVIFSQYFEYINGLEDKFKVITAIAMFYDLDDPMAFLLDVRKMLHRDGVFIIQMNYLATMLRDNAFDNISHEHLCYYSLTSLIPLLHRAGMHVERVSLNNVNGGSIQVWCRKGIGTEPNDDIAALLDVEKSMGLDTPFPYEDFAKRVVSIGGAVSETLAKYPYDKIYLCGASTRGSTLLQTFGINFARVKGAGERDPRKHGLITAGSWIPIVSEEEAREKASIMLVLPWHFRQEIELRERDFINRGGKLLFPLPEPNLVVNAMDYSGSPAGVANT